MVIEESWGLLEAVQAKVASKTLISIDVHAFGAKEVNALMRGESAIEESGFDIMLGQDKTPCDSTDRTKLF